MKCAASGKTDPGLKRRKNDDSFLVDEALGLYIVCDGVGGNLAGNIASEMCCKIIAEYVTSNRHVVKAYGSQPTSIEAREAVSEMLRKAITLANERIFQAAQADPSRHGMSTTCVALLIANDFAFLAHVGDSRAYLLRSAKTHQLTEDHKYGNEMLKQGLWTPEQVKSSPHSRVLTRAVGIQAVIQVDLLQLELASGDVFLLCSDGLADYLKAEQIENYVKAGPFDALPSRLVEFARASGGHDNITAVTVRTQADELSKDAALDALRKSEILGKVPLFRYLSYAELTKVLGQVKLRSFARGGVLIQEGTSSSEMFVIVSGSVDVLKGRQKVSAKGRGDFLGEMGLFDNAPRSASVVASELTSAMVLERGDLLNLLRHESQIAVKFLWALNQEMNQRLRQTSLELAETKASLEKVHSNKSELPFTVTLDIPELDVE